MKQFRPTLVIACPVIVGAVVFLAGIDWGLPSRAVDQYLFGEHPIWTGKQIAHLAGPTGAEMGGASDVSAGAPTVRDRPVVVNATDQDRARIIRRYRLMSYQPDEFTTFAALSAMKVGRGDLDPRMYKYGGLWVYPVGALLKLAGRAGIVQLDSDVTFYLDHPESFGRFYIVARAYSACWGLVGIAAVFLLIKRICGNTAAAIAGALCFLLMPLVVTAAHEAKPHLAGAVLMLLAVLTATKFVEGGLRRFWLAAAWLSGAAIAMVPSALPSLLILPLMMFLRSRAMPSIRAPRARGAILAVLIALAVYLLVNPYVPAHLLWRREVLRSNVGNSAAFYHPRWGGGGLPNALLLIAEGTSFLLAGVGLVATIVLALRVLKIRRSVDPLEVRRRAGGMLLAAPAIAVAVPFILFAHGQPADYARFALPFDIFLCIEAVVAIATFIRSPAARAVFLALLVLSTSYTGLSYLRAFRRDAIGPTTRMLAAARLAELQREGFHVLASRQEPAPWSLPPVNLFEWQIIVPPRQEGRLNRLPGAEVTVAPVDMFPGPGSKALRLLRSTPIAWADKPFIIEVSVNWQPRRSVLHQEH